MIIWFDPSGKITYTNHAARELLIAGNRDQVVSISSVLQESPSGTWESLWDQLREKKRLFHESLLVLPDKTTTPAEILYNHIRYGNDEYCCCIARDIHERKLALAELIESENRFRQLAGIIPEVFYLYDLKTGSLLYVNPAFEQIFGRPLDDIYLNPGSWKEQIHPDDQDLMVSVLSDQSGSVREGEGRIIRPDGSIRWIFARIFSIFDSDNHPYREVGVISDITDHKKTEEELTHTNERFFNHSQGCPGLHLHPGFRSHIHLGRSVISRAFSFRYTR